MVKTQPSNAGVVGSIPGQGTEISHAARRGQKVKINLKKKKKKNTSDKTIKSIGCRPHAPGEIGTSIHPTDTASLYPSPWTLTRKVAYWELAMTSKRAQ